MHNLKNIAESKLHLLYAYHHIFQKIIFYKKKLKKKLNIN